MIFKVTEVSPPGAAWKSSFGSMMLTYYIKGELDGGEEEQAQINTLADKPKVPFVGEMIECKIKKEHPQYGKTLEREPSNPGASGGHSGGYTPRTEDPLKQAMIVRQNALGNAVQFQYNLALLTKKPEIYTTDNILMIATKFAAFSIGELKSKAPVHDEEPFPDHNEEGE